MKIAKTYSSATLRIYLRGDLDQHTARETMRVIDNLVDEHLPKKTVLDLMELSFMDSSGIALVLKLHKKMKSIGGVAEVENVSRQVMKVLDAATISRIVSLKGA